jgi:cell division protein FtsI/penicillin-binding protein 2
VEVRGRSAAVNHRLASTAVILFLWALAILARLIVLQVVQHTKYVEIARKQQEEQIPIPAPRGSIFDRNGQPLAISVPVDSLSVNPRQITDPRLASEVLASYLKLDEATLYSRLATARSSHKGFLWIKHDMDPFETERLKRCLAYATFHTESDRHYPSGENALHRRAHAVCRGARTEGRRGSEARAQRHGDRDEPVYRGDSGAGELSDLRSQPAAEARATIRYRDSIWARRCRSSRGLCSKSSR